MTDIHTKVVFDKRQTNIAKGVALLLLLWHHLFYNSPEVYTRFSSLWLFRGVPIECQLARFCKVCVAIFLLLSGYGLTKSYSRYLDRHSNDKKLHIKESIKYTLNHLIKLLSDYWIIYIIFVPMGLFFGVSFLEKYGTNPLHYFSEFFGFSYLISGDNYADYSMNLTWWFMSIILVYYLVFPILYKLLKYSPELLLLTTLIVLFCPYIPDFRSLKVYICPFILGMYISHYNSFDTLARRINSNLKAILVSAFAVFFSAYLRFSLFGDSTAIDFLFAFSVILFSFLVLSKIPILNTVLEHLGKYSGMIFMFHTFIYSLYFQDFIYWFKYPPIIFLVLTVICYVVAVGLEYLKKLIRYDKLVKKVTQ